MTAPLTALFQMLNRLAVSRGPELTSANVTLAQDDYHSQQVILQYVEPYKASLVYPSLLYSKVWPIWGGQRVSAGSSTHRCEVM